MGEVSAVPNRAKENFDEDDQIIIDVPTSRLKAFWGYKEITPRCSRGAGLSSVSLSKDIVHHIAENCATPEAMPKLWTQSTLSS